MSAGLRVHVFLTQFFCRTGKMLHPHDKPSARQPYGLVRFMQKLKPGVYFVAALVINFQEMRFLQRKALCFAVERDLRLLRRWRCRQKFVFL